MKLYCQKCGSGTEYSFDRPKFCASCGGSFGGVQPRPKTQVQRPSRITPDEDSEEGNERVPDIKKLDFDIDVGQRRSEKISNLAGTKGDSGFEDRGTGGKLDKKEVLEMLKKEAGFYPTRQEIDEE